MNAKDTFFGNLVEVDGRQLGLVEWVDIFEQDPARFTGANFVYDGRINGVPAGRIFTTGMLGSPDALRGIDAMPAEFFNSFFSQEERLKMINSK